MICSCDMFLCAMLTLVVFILSDATEAPLPLCQSRFWLCIYMYVAGKARLLWSDSILSNSASESYVWSEKDLSKVADFHLGGKLGDSNNNKHWHPCARHSWSSVC